MTTAAIIISALLVIILVAMARSRRRSEETIRVLLSDGEEHRGLDLIAQSAGILTRGTVYVHLARMEERGEITSRSLSASSTNDGWSTSMRLYRIAEQWRGDVPPRPVPTEPPKRERA